MIRLFTLPSQTVSGPGAPEWTIGLCVAGVDSLTLSPRAKYWIRGGLGPLSVENKVI